MSRAFAAVVLLLTACTTFSPRPALRGEGPGVRGDAYIPITWDEKSGRLFIEPRFNEPMIYQTSLPAGVGSNPIGLDRGELSGTHLVHF